MTRRVFLLLPAVLVQAADWQNAKVLHAEYKADNTWTGMAPAGGPATQVFRGEFDFDAGDTVYTARESVTRTARLPLAEGDSVLMQVEKDTIRLRLPDGKIRKLKLGGTYPKTKR